MLNITSYQGNANQNHKELSHQSSKIGCQDKIQEGLERTWGKRALLVGT